MRDFDQIKADLHCDADCSNCPDAGLVPCARVYRTIQDVPDLLAEVERLRAQLQECDAERQELRGDIGQKLVVCSGAEQCMSVEALRDGCKHIRPHVRTRECGMTCPDVDENPPCVPYVESAQDD